MPGLTYDQIRALVFSFQKARDATVVSTDIDAAINASINQILRQAEISNIQFDPPAFNTVANTDEYNINDSVFKILEMEITDAGIKSALSFISWRKWKTYKHGTPVTGKPENWTVWSNKIRLWPIPSAVYSITYPSLKKVGGIDAIAEEFRDVVLNGALAVFEPRYIAVFEKGKEELYAYWEKERASNNDWQGDADVEAHHVATRLINVV